MFSSGRELAELQHEGHSGRPTRACSEVNINTVRKMAAIMNHSKMTIENIMKCKLRIRRVAAMWVPHHLTLAQMDKRVKVCEAWKKRNTEQIVKTVA